MATTIQIGTVFEESPVISANGQYVVFRRFDEIYLRDLLAGENSLISVSSEEEVGNGSGSSSFDSVAISADGRFVAFESSSTNLVPNDTNGESDIFLRDTVEGTISLISLDSEGNQIPANTFDTQLRPSISSDGRFVAFQTEAPFGGGPDQDIFVRDVVANTTELISVNSEGVPADGVSFAPSISADGRYVAFYSLADNLVAEETIIDYDVFVRDRQEQTTIVASVNSQGQEGTGVSENEIPNVDDATEPVISPDGSYVVFQSGFTNLVPNDTNGFSDIFKHDLETGETTRISVDSNGNQANGGSLLGFNKSAISADGRYIVFQSGANNLVEGDTNNATDVFVRDTVEETTTRVSINAEGEEPVGGFLGTASVDGTISGDGRYIVFLSNGRNMNDEGIDTDLIYLRDTGESTDGLPTVANPMADITVEKDAENQTIDLSDVFRDADGDEISITVQSNSHPELVSVIIEDNNLTLDFQENQSGTAEIILRATANGETVDDTFTVTVNTTELLNTNINRFQNTDISGTYLFAGDAESEVIRADFPNFEEEGLAFKVADEPGDDLRRINRFQSTITPGTYLFAAEEESESIRENFSDSFTEEGLAFYVYGVDTGNGTEFIRFQNEDRPGTYLFASPDEAESIRNNFPNFIEEGAAFEVGI